MLRILTAPGDVLCLPGKKPGKHLVTTDMAWCAISNKGAAQYALVCHDSLTDCVK